MIRNVSALAVLVFAAAGCDEKLREFAGPTPNLQPSLSAIQRDIFDAPDATGRPACTSCHNPRLARLNGGLDLSGSNAYGALVGTPSRDKPGAVRVIPGDPENSYLVRKIQGGPDIAGDRMPQSGPFLTSGQIQIIRRWIELGANSN